MHAGRCTLLLYQVPDMVKVETRIGDTPYDTPCETPYDTLYDTPYDW